MAITPVNISNTSKFTRFVNSLGGRTLLPLLMTEACVETGRTYQAYKRGGFTEARERITEEFLGAVCWFGAIPVVDALLSKVVGENILKLPKQEVEVQPGFIRKSINKLFGKENKPIKKMKLIPFDVGIDAGRDSISNYADNLLTKSEFKGMTKEQLIKKISNYRALKIGTAVIAGILLVGGVLPKLNQGITKLLKRKNDEKQNNPSQHLVQPKMDDFINQSANAKKDIAFTGGLLNLVNIVENTPRIQLASEDVGVATGRGTNARNKYERREVLFRDLTSAYFYLFNMPIMAHVLNRLEQNGLKTRLDAVSANAITNDVANILSENGNKMSVANFEKVMFGDVESAGYKTAERLKLSELFKSDGYVKPEVLEQLGLNTQQNKKGLFKRLFTKKSIPVDLSTLSEIDKSKLKSLVEILKDNGHIEIDKLDEVLSKIDVEVTGDLRKVAEEMSQLQPKLNGKSILTGTQVVDVIKGGKVNSPEIMHHIVQLASTNDPLFNPKSNTYKGEFNYVPQSSIIAKKNDVQTFIKECISKAKAEGKEITVDLFKKAQRKNLAWNAFNWISAFVTTALFVSTLIPKMQYWITKKTTGSDKFPGTEMTDDTTKKTA